MLRILIAYSTSEGQTHKVSEYIADLLRERGHVIDVVNVDTLGKTQFETEYDAAILGASIHLGKHQKAMVRFAKEHAVWLDTLPCAFFSVSLTSSRTDYESRKQAEGYVDEFVQETCWVPDRIWLVAGSLAYRKYSFLKRMMVRQVVKAEGGETDTSKNHEYTDWQDLSTSVVEFLNTIIEPHFAGTGSI